MIIRIVLLLISFLILINLILLSCCYITGVNIYKKYAKQLIISFSIFILLIIAFYIAIAFIGLG